MRTIVAAVIVCIASMVWIATGNAATPAQVATWAAGKPVTVQPDMSGLYGWATPSTSTIHVAPYLLDSLNDPHAFRPGRTRFVRAGYTQNASDWDAIALQTVLHEAMHLRFPTAPEGAVDCAAYLMVPAALDRFYGFELGSPQAARLWWFHAYQFDCGWFS